MKIVVHSLDEITRFSPDDKKKHIAIRLGDFENQLSDGFRDILTINFSDITEEEYWDLKSKGMKSGFTLFEKEHAQSILSFVDKHKDADSLHIHCHMGVSRSPAVAISVAQWLGLPSDNIEYGKKKPVPNPTVLSVFNEILSQKV